jgi:hypothetical protein
MNVNNFIFVSMYVATLDPSYNTSIVCTYICLMAGIKFSTSSFISFWVFFSFVRLLLFSYENRWFHQDKNIYTVLKVAAIQLYIYLHASLQEKHIYK